MTIRLMSCMTYEDAPRLIPWLVEAFGFTVRTLSENGKGGIAHCELILEDAMIAVNSPNDSEFGRAVSTPVKAGTTTQTVYLIIEDVPGAYARATAAGARMMIPLRTESYGGQSFTCFDPEGHIWTLGSYDPMAQA